MRAIAEHLRRLLSVTLDREVLAAIGSLAEDVSELPPRGPASRPPRTFRYRLKRGVEIAGINLDDPAERLALQVELALDV